MWYRRSHYNTSTLFLVVDSAQAALIRWEDNHKALHPFTIKSYDALPVEWFLHGAPWHMSSFTTYLQSYVKQHNLKKPLLVCACNGETTYEKITTLTHTPTQAVIPPDQQFSHYAWHATLLSTNFSTLSTSTGEVSPTPAQHTPDQTEKTRSFLISGIPYNDILRLRLCADKSNCILHRVTTVRASIQLLYTYCQRHGITPENFTPKNTSDTITQQNSYQHETTHKTDNSPETLLTKLCSPLPEKHTSHLVLSALSLSLFERNYI